MNVGLEALISASAIGRNLHRPEFFRLKVPAERNRLYELLKTTPQLRVHAELRSQLSELVRAMNPSVKYSKEELHQAVDRHLGSVPEQEYGVWVYYPWSARLVHLLDEAEFAMVRTDRNRNKITGEEQARLAQLKVGVVGLSVGQSICLTLALERGFGELRIADHDLLELSNLNRIRSGVHCMGHLKTVNVAREIAEIDPFLKVTLFNEGLNGDNIARFIGEGGKLDVLIDECDSVDVKLLLRQRAKALRVPVIMDTSDRGMLDVERFDLEPDRPILHGLIEHLDPADAAKARTNEEKLPFILPMLNISTLSKRMKASMLEIESSVATWPQLASSVVLGGAVAADVVRRIALGQFTASGRWFVDMEEIVGPSSKAPAKHEPEIGAIPEPIDHEAMVLAAEALRSPHPVLPIGEAEAGVLVEAASLAPSGGNSQPWRFLLHADRLFLFMDPARSFSTIDPGRICARLGLGACLENILLKAREIGSGLDVDLSRASSDGPLVAVISKASDTAAVLPPDPLGTYLRLRCTNRHQGKGASLPADLLEALKAAVSTAVPEAVVQFATTRSEVERIGALCGAAERVRMLNPRSHWDLFHREMRWTRADAERTRDGVDIDTLELSLSDRTAIEVAADAEAVSLLHGWHAGRGFERFSRKLISASAAVALVRMPVLSPVGALRGGRAVQRLWLRATQAQLAVQPISAPIFMGLHARYDRTGMFNEADRAELADILTQLCKHFAPADAEPFFLLRLDHADPPSVRSLRKPVEDVLFVHRTVAA